MEFNFQDFINFKNISSNSISIYRSNFNTLIKTFNNNDDTDLEFIFNYKKICDYFITKYTLSTFKNYIAFIINIIRFLISNEMERQILNESKILKLRNLCQIYSNKYKIATREITKSVNKYNNQLKNIEDNEDFFKVSMIDIVNYRLQFKNWIVKNQFLESSIEFFNTDLFNKIQYYIIICLYTLIPPRRSEYGNMKIINYDDYLNYDKEKLLKNYLVKKENGDLFFLFGRYKTFKRYGTQLFKLDDELLYTINKWIKFTKNEYLLINNKGKPLNGAIISRFTDSFRLLTGDFYTMNITQLRNIYIAENVNKENNIKMGNIYNDSSKINISNKITSINFD